MKHKLPILPAVALGLTIGLASLPLLRPMLLARAGASAVEATPSVAPDVEPSQPLVRQAATSLATRHFVNAKLRLRVDLFDHQLNGNGRYLQGASETRQFRYELKLPLGDSFSSVQQVCDGQTLWIRRQAEGPATVSKVDLAKIDRAKLDPAKVEAADAHGVTANSVMPMLAPTAGGLAGVLAGLDRAFDFRTTTASALGDVHVQVVSGIWKPSHLTRMLPDQKDAIEAGGNADLSKLPKHMPDHVVVYLGRDDLFPYRIEYWRSHDGNPLGAAVGASSAKLMVSLEMYEVRLGTAVDAQEFVCTPGSTPVADETAAYLTELGLIADKATP